MLKRIVFFLILLTVNTVISQNEKRVVVEMHKTFDECFTELFGTDGLLNFCREVKPSKNGYNWKVTRFDKDLNETNHTVVTVSKKAVLIKRMSDENYMYLYFKTGSKEILIYRIHHLSLKQDKFEETFPQRIIETKFVVNNDKLYMYVKDNLSVYLKTINFETLQSEIQKIRIGNFDSNSYSLRSMKLDSTQQELFLTISTNSETSSNTSVLIMDESGKLKRIFHPNVYTQNYIHSMDSKSLDATTQLYWGTYSSLEQKEYQEGIFYFVVEDDEVITQSFILIADLSAFKKYLENATNKEVKKALRDIQLAIHSPLIVEDKIILTTELFGKTYASDAGLVVMGGGLGLLIGYHFDGYLYLGASVVCIDASAVVLWDNLLDLNLRLKPMKLNYQVQIESSKETISFTYPSGNTLKNKKFSIEGDELEESSMELPLLLDSLGNYSFWYEQTYVDANYFDNYIVFNEESITDKVTVKQRAYYIESKNFKNK